MPHNDLLACPYHGTTYESGCPVCRNLMWDYYDQHIAPNRVVRIPPQPTSEQPRPRYRRHKRQAPRDIDCTGQPIRIRIIDL